VTFHKTFRTCFQTFVLGIPPTGEILAEYIQSGQYDRVFYIGDSDNDFCPSALLSKYAHAILQSHTRHARTHAHTRTQLMFHSQR
jgi:hypothetical protein